MVEEASDSSHDICIDESASIKPSGISQHTRSAAESVQPKFVIR
jgi:hypothetical protein